MDELLLKFDIPEDARHDLVSLFSEKKLMSGDILFDYQDDAEALFFLREGNLAVHKLTGFLEKMQVIALLDPGAVVGEAAFLNGHVRKTRVTAIKDSLVVCLRKSDFTGFRKKFPESGFYFLEYLFSIVTLRLEKTSERLARIL